MALQVTLADGTFGAVVPGGAPTRPQAKKQPPGGQGDLF